jgi:hypothetical protein
MVPHHMICSSLSGLSKRLEVSEHRSLKLLGPSQFMRQPHLVAPPMDIGNPVSGDVVKCNSTSVARCLTVVDLRSHTCTPRMAHT